MIGSLRCLVTQPSRRVAVAAGVGVAAALHALTPAGPHAWHWLHLVAGKLYLLPILLAAAWFGARARRRHPGRERLVGRAHRRDWAGLAMVQAEQLAEIATFWIVGLVSSALFRREREAREATRRAHEETLTALAGSLELRERYTAGHSRRSPGLRPAPRRRDGAPGPRLPRQPGPGRAASRRGQDRDPRPDPAEAGAARPGGAGRHAAASGDGRVPHRRHRVPASGPRADPGGIHERYDGGATREASPARRYPWPPASSRSRTPSTR